MTAGLVLGYVLAGGESSRMQRADLPRDKALLQLEGQTLLERTLATVASVCPDPRILCGSPERCTRLRRFGSMVPDRVGLAGPLGGLHAALHDAHERGAEWGLLMPVDLPGMTGDLLQWLVREVQTSGSAAACMRADEFTQPLPAIVHTGARFLVTEALQAGDRKLLPVLRGIALSLGSRSELLVLDVGKLVPADGDRNYWFQNVNTPEDFKMAQQHETLRTRPHQSKHGE